MKACVSSVSIKTYTGIGTCVWGDKDGSDMPSRIVARLGGRAWGGLAAGRKRGPTAARHEVVDVLEISLPNDLGGIANLGLTLPEAKQLLARVQQELSNAWKSGRR